MVVNKKNTFSWIIVFILCFVISLFFVFFRNRKVDVSLQKKIVCTTFPSYDWVYNIVGNDSSTLVYYLTEKSGIDYHFYTPSDNDLEQIKNCDLLICNGKEDGIWAEKAASESGKNITVVNLQKLLEKKLNEEGKNDLGKEIDEHVWLSVKNAEFFVEELCSEIISIDLENKAVYESNAKKYLNKLNFLDEEFTEAFNNSKNYAIILADKNPFTYLMNDYNINYFSALPNCVALKSEKNNGPEEVEKCVDENTIHFLTEKMDMYNLNFVYKIDDSNDKLSHYVIRDSKNKLSDILVLDTMHKSKLSEILKGKTYIKTMRDNLTELKKVL